MIFLTVGTHEPFDRLVQAVDEWYAQYNGNNRLVGQITKSASYKPSSFEWVETLPASSYEAHCTEADFIISHAGTGSIITALTLGKPIVVLPRRGHLSETRNDHQQATALRFCKRQGILVALTEADLPGLLDRLTNADDADAVPTIGPFADDTLIGSLRDFILR